LLRLLCIRELKICSVGPPEKDRKSRSVLSRRVVEDSKPEGTTPDDAASDAPIEFAEPEVAALVDAEGRDDEIEDTTVEDGEAEEHIELEIATSDRSADVGNYDVPSESDISVYEPKLRRKKAAVKEKGKGPAKTTKTTSVKPRGGAKKTISRQQPRSPPTTVSRANKSSIRGPSNTNSGPSASKTGQVLRSLPVNSKKGSAKQGNIAPKTKRKAKQPLVSLTLFDRE
jgi:hypothetical protein